MMPSRTSSSTTFVHQLRAHAEQRPDRRAFLYLERGEVEAAELSFAQLDQRARAVAASLQGRVAPGERVLLLCPQGLDFISAFFGCLYAGVIAVPAYPPRANHHLLRIRAIAQDSEPRAVLATRKVLGTSGATLREIPELAAAELLAVDELDLAAAGDWRLPAVGPDTLALLQYTSGSTGVPRGVMVSHGNLLHNEELIREGYEHTDEAVIVSWLPLFHDMGLIGSALQAAYLGVPCVLMSPVDFIQKPVRWLQAVSRYRATSSGGPNFAYDHCVRRVTPEQCQGLDLSGWKAAFSGSEPIRSLTLRRFAEVFSAYGFRQESFYPCYGLAEATLFVTGATVGRAPVLRELDAEALGAHQVRPAAGAAERASLVGCGHPRADLRVEIVDPTTRLRCPADQVGEVWVSGPSVAHGYWKRPDATEETFGATLADDANTRFLRTGDLGFFDQGSLYVTGRLKDLIILRGRNHYPQDIERTVDQSHAALRTGCGAAFSVDVDGEERLVVVQEVDQPNRIDVEGVSRAVRRAVSQHHEITPHAVVLIRPATLLKTSSGKVQRRACKAAYLEGELKTVGVSLLAQDDSLSSEVAPLSRAAVLEQPSGARRAFLVERLRQQVARALRVAPGDLGQDQPLTALGVDSLSIVELKNELEAALVLRLPHSFFLQEDVSLELLADRLLESLGDAPSTEPAPALEASREVFPCSYGQQALLFEQQWAPQSTAYNVSVAARIGSQVDVPALQRAIEHLMRRHPVLRTTYELAGSEWVQRIHAGQPLPFRHQDVSAWTPEARVAWLEEQAHTPFDLARGPVFRVELLSARRDEHLLLLVAHHVAVDMWSLVVLLDELSQLYPAECARGEAPLKPLPAGYEDYVRWQAARLAGAGGEQDRTYWKERLSGQLPVLALPTDRVRPRVWSAKGGKHGFTLPAELTERLQTLSRAQGSTLYTTLLAAYQALLHRYTGQDELVIGSPASGRGRAEFEDVVGYFVNPVAIRTHCEGSTSWQVLLARTRQAVLEALDHQDYPHPLLVQQLGLARDTARAPLFQTMFALLKPPREQGAALGSFLLAEGGGRVDLGGLELESLHLGQRAAQFDLCLTLVEQGNRLLGSFEFCTDLFERETIAAMARHFQRLLESLAENPAAPISRLELLTGEEKAALVRQGWQQVPHPRELCMHQLLELQARQRPNAVALVSGTRRLTYQELDARANQLAHTLLARGLRRGEVVAILLERELDALVAMMGVMKAGGAFLPLDGSVPPERLAAMLGASRITTLLTRQRWRDVLPSTHASILDLDAEAASIARAPVEPPGARVSPEDPAYVIYTSGTTGTPKGVMVSHGSVLNAAYVWRDYYRLEQQEAVSLQLSSFAFDIFIGDLMKVLISGGRLVICPEESRTDLPALAALIARERITFLDAAPSLVLSLMEESVRQQWPLESLKVVIMGGEAIDLERFRALHERFGARLRLVAAVGITETTVDSSCYELVGPSVPTGTSGYVPLGRPLPNTRFYVLDEHLSPRPAGVIGELYIAGPGVALGYLEQPVLTAERFLPDPFFPGERMYRTGDLARWLGEGIAEFRGRGDHQVKIRGFRIETGDIEANLLRHPAVAQAVVVAWEDAQRTRRLAAYVASRENTPLDVEELRTHLRKRLPEYMVPSVLLQLPALPLTPNGKVDRRALPPPDPAQVGGRAAYVAPTNPLEQQLASLWSELLGVERVGIHDNFFELGGHSLLATQLVSRLRETLRVELPLRTLFESLTVAELARAVEQLRNQSGMGSAEPELKRAPGDAEALLEQLDELSEDELDQLLAREGLK